MPEDKENDATKRGKPAEQAGKSAADKNMQAGGTAGGLNKETKKGLGKSEDKIRDRLKG
jgi:hypothetical protein